jgi:RimJ/RimL family protein N-acetyltransferase
VRTGLARIRTLLVRSINLALRPLGARLVRLDEQHYARDCVGGPEIALPSRPLVDGPAVLRPVRMADVPELVRICRDESIIYWAGWPSPFGEADAREWVRTRAALRTIGETVDLLVVDGDSNRVAGWLALHSIDRANRRASIGLFLAPEARGKGLMSRSLNMFTTWVFETMPIDRLELLTLTTNQPTLALAERCGYVREGVLRACLVRRRARHDAVLHSALRSEWPVSSASR